MRNFIAFIQRFRILLFFAALQAVVLSIYFTFSTFPRSQYLTTASTVSGNILRTRNDLTKHFNLSKSNLRLQKENIELRRSLRQSQLLLHTRTLSDTVFLDSNQFIQRFEYIPGTIVNSTYSKRNNYFTLDIGKAQGVQAKMGVISDKGVVGVIHNVGEHFSVVKSCLTEDININLVIEETGEPGLLKWNGRNPKHGMMSGVSNDTKIDKWSSIVTGGKSGIFPRGIPVGKVLNTSVIEGKSLWDIQVLFSENYRSVQYVYVIKNLFKEEQHELEALNPIDIE